MKTDEAKQAYKPRKELIEPTFGLIKEQMGIRRFLLRGLDNVRAEGCFVATAFNLRTLYGAWKAWESDKRKELFALIRLLREVSLLISDLFFTKCHNITNFEVSLIIAG